MFKRKNNNTIKSNKSNKSDMPQSHSKFQIKKILVLAIVLIKLKNKENKNNWIDLDINEPNYCDIKFNKFIVFCYQNVLIICEIIFNIKITGSY